MGVAAIAMRVVFAFLAPLSRVNALPRLARLLLAVTLASAISAASASAASITITGTDGAPGADGGTSSGLALPGAPGSDGEDVVVDVYSETDRVNDGNAYGGAGGRGGNGGTGTVGGAGAAGGSGGDASSTVETPAGASAEICTGLLCDARANARAYGGRGGYGGWGGTGTEGTGPYGTGGTGGDAATSATVASAGHAFATARSEGGDGGSGGANGDWKNGDGGDAVANARADSDTLADASSLAVGGDGQSGGNAWAESVAVSPTSAKAFANAWGGWSSAQASGTLHARANAISASGVATAEAQQHGGDSGIGPGMDVEIVDAVSGSGAVSLALSQTAEGGNGATGTRGGSARSELHAVNPLNASLSAASSAIGGDVSGNGRGGDALARVTATSPSSAPVRASASARGGEVTYRQTATSFGGDAEAHASASGLGLIDSIARATSLNGKTLSAESEALSPFRFTALRSFAVQTVEVRNPADPYLRTTTSNVSLTYDDPWAYPVLPSPGNAVARLYARPEDVVSAGGSVGASAQLGDQIALRGRMEMDLADAFIDPEDLLTVVISDPVALGDGLDLLHLSFSRDDEVLFELSTADTATALAELDEVKIDLGSLAGGGDLTSLVLEYELHVDASAVASGFAFRVALVEPVPEPWAGILALGPALGLFVARARLRKPTP